MRTRTPRGGQIETSPEAEAFLARLEEAVSSFFRRLDGIVEDANWRMSTPTSTSSSSASSSASSIKKESITNNQNQNENTNETTKKTTTSKKVGNRKKAAASSSRGFVADVKRPTSATMAPPKISPTKAIAPVNTLARAFLRKAFRGRF